jgi:hypothetical protein
MPGQPHIGALSFGSNGAAIARHLSGSHSSRQIGLISTLSGDMAFPPFFR